MKKLPANKDKEEEYIPPPDDYISPTLDDVFGTTKLKQDLDEILINIDKSTLYEMYTCKPYKTFLFQGKPGTGKTYSYKALRNQMIADGNSVAPLSYDIGNYGSAFINEGTKILQRFFNTGHKLANDGWIVMYWFDEADAVMSKRGGTHSHKEDDKLLDCLMKNVQQITSYCDNEYIFFATNFPGAMDEAATRSGRIDKVVKFEIPEFDARKRYIKYRVDSINTQILEHYNDEIKLFKKLNYNKLSDLTNGFNFADLNSLIDRTIRSGVYDLIQDPKLDATLILGEKDIIRNINLMKQEKDYKTTSKIGFVS